MARAGAAAQETRPDRARRGARAGVPRHRDRRRPPCARALARRARRGEVRVADRSRTAAGVRRARAEMDVSTGARGDSRGRALVDPARGRAWESRARARQRAALYMRSDTPE